MVIIPSGNVHVPSKVRFKDRIIPSRTMSTVIKYALNNGNALLDLLALLHKNCTLCVRPGGGLIITALYITAFCFLMPLFFYADIWRQCICSGETDEPVPVSYTHLDVYKRQVYIREVYVF